MDATRRLTYLNALGIDPWAARVSHDVPQTDPKPLENPAPISPTNNVAPLQTRALPIEFKTDAGPKVEMSTYQPPTDWTELKATVAGCTRCKLCETRTKTVFGVGLDSSPLMIIGEGPGADEDAQGEPFVGRAGKLLDEMLRAIGRSRREAAPDKAVFIANVVKCRPPGNRDPEADEVEACRPYLDVQIKHVKPKLIVALGRIAAQRLLATDAPLSKLRGVTHAYGADKTPVFVTYHPAYLLRSPGEKAKSWADLKLIHQFLTN
jgi:DNA polymerase